MGQDIYPDFDSFKVAMDKFYRDKWLDEKKEVAKLSSEIAEKKRQLEEYKSILAEAE